MLLGTSDVCQTPQGMLPKQVGTELVRRSIAGIDILGWLIKQPLKGRKVNQWTMAVVRQLSKNTDLMLCNGALTTKHSHDPRRIRRLIISPP